MRRLPRSYEAPGRLSGSGSTGDMKKGLSRSDSTPRGLPRNDDVPRGLPRNDDVPRVLPGNNGGLSRGPSRLRRS